MKTTWTFDTATAGIGSAGHRMDVCANNARRLCYLFTRGSPTAIKYLVLRLDQAHSEKRSPASQLHMYIEPSTPPIDGSSVWHAMPTGVREYCQPPPVLGLNHCSKLPWFDPTMPL